MQLEQGVFRSHFILRCWQRTQARILGALPAVVEVEEGVGAPVDEDMIGASRVEGKVRWPSRVGTSGGGTFMNPAGRCEAHLRGTELRIFEHVWVDSC